jgi:hypothetical protein
MVKQRQPEQVVVYQMKVKLTDIEPPIWRRFLVTGEHSLYRLHLILQAIMGWENYRSAAQYAERIKRLYRNVLKEPEGWETYIQQLRATNKNLPAMQDEFSHL